MPFNLTTEYIGPLYSGPNPVVLAGAILGFISMFYFRDSWFSVVTVYVTFCILVLFACITKLIPEAYFPSITDAICNVGIVAPISALFSIAVSTTLENYLEIPLPAILSHSHVNEKFPDSLSIIWATIRNKTQGLHENEISWWRRAVAAVFLQMIVIWVSGWLSFYGSTLLLAALSFLLQMILISTVKLNNRKTLCFEVGGVILSYTVLVLMPWGSFVLASIAAIVSAIVFASITKPKQPESMKSLK